jgi:hypothetical protein
MLIITRYDEDKTVELGTLKFENDDEIFTYLNYLMGNDPTQRLRIKRAISNGTFPISFTDSKTIDGFVYPFKYTIDRIDRI